MNSIILSGGGIFGAFEAGVLYSIFGKIKIDKCFGTSAGALNSLLFAQACIDGNPEIFKKIWLETIKKNSDIYSESNWKWIILKPAYSLDPLKKLLKKIVNIKEILKLEQEIKVVSVDLISGYAVHFSNKDDLTEDELLDAVIASASVPPVFPPVRLRDKILVDGGTRHNVPCFLAENPDIETAIVILCDTGTMKPSTKNFDRIIELSSRVISIMIDEITNNDVELAKKIAEKILKIKSIKQLHIISPDEDSDHDILDFNPVFSKRLFDLGVEKGNRFLEGYNLS